MSRVSLTSCCAAALLAACASWAPATPTPQVVVEVMLDYMAMPYEQIIADSGAIFVGQVLEVSPTSWNQDSGEYWRGGLPVYTIEVKVLQMLVDNLALPDEVTVTQVAYSPHDGGKTQPVAGQRAVFFVVPRAIAWRDGVRPVLRTTNTDTDSIIVIGDENLPAQPTEEAARLDEIIRDIAAHRDDLLLTAPAATGTPD